MRVSKEDLRKIKEIQNKMQTIIFGHVAKTKTFYWCLDLLIDGATSSIEDFSTKIQILPWRLFEPVCTGTGAYHRLIV